ncbi:putative addiction module antidote protein [Georgenia yuyongxinii]|uniref:Putative addiction module antidote protein n=1 Tax=Georgenia yuyongxinii TaxID=2589797 RepID=A0A5B8C7T5_9MICO|nr:addiction module antidote protein [Georgenia yuyongxinii]QDC23986.1 putative addiction module antidote protein [Georgenia yuyongxinii]
MAEKFTTWDAANHLENLGEVAEFLEAVFEEAGDDPAFVAQALATIARSGNVSELARRIGMSREGLYKALSADSSPSFATIMKVAKALGLKLHFESVA